MAAVVQKASVDNLRSSDALTVQVLVADLLRLHIERIETSVVADLFALADAGIPGSLGADLKAWAGRATREVLDIPDGEARRTFLAEVAALPGGAVSERLREAIGGLTANSSSETLAVIDTMVRAWESVPPVAVVLPTKKGKVAAAAAKAEAAGPKKVVGAPKRAAVPRTPAADVDPRRAAYIREDVTGTLQHLERGIKDSVLVGGIRHRSPFKDMTEAEIKAELRKLERERKLKKTGERWTIR